MFIHTHIVMLLRYLPSLDGKLKRFVTKNLKSGCQTRVRLTLVHVRAALPEGDQLMSSPPV